MLTCLELQVKIYYVKEKCGFVLIFLSSVADILHFQPGTTERPLIQLIWCMFYVKSPALARVRSQAPRYVR